jgi:hypothetical protein
MPRVRRHKVFVSYHHENDQRRRNSFEQAFADVYNIMDSRSVKIGDIPRGLNTDEVARRIRDDYLKDTTVTVVLIGEDTWRRKHVDWEIAATVRDTDANLRGGLIGILLPSHPSYRSDHYYPYTIPPRLHYNVDCGFAKVYKWNDSPDTVAGWIGEAFKRRNSIEPDNGFIRFRKNRKGPRWYPQRSQS